MDYRQAFELLQSFKIEKDHDWDRHCILVGETAYILAEALEPFISIEPSKVRLMGLVHDFGRSVSQCPFRHAYEGYKLLNGIGENELARICVCHSNGTFRPEEIDEYGLKPDDFFVKTIEEKLVFIADNMECHGKIVRQPERLGEAIERYRDKNPEMLPVFYQKFKEFDRFDSEIRHICGQGMYDILGI